MDSPIIFFLICLSKTPFQHLHLRRQPTTTSAAAFNPPTPPPPIRFQTNYTPIYTNFLMMCP
ncbi:hypothetical protein Hanom_Chr05g00444571 [Helianthus anomalus]